MIFTCLAASTLCTLRFVFCTIGRPSLDSVCLVENGHPSVSKSSSIAQPMIGGRSVSERTGDTEPCLTRHQNDRGLSCLIAAVAVAAVAVGSCSLQAHSYGSPCFSPTPTHTLPHTLTHLSTIPTQPSTHSPPTPPLVAALIHQSRTSLEDACVTPYTISLFFRPGFPPSCTSRQPPCPS